ncbi:YhhN-like protein [Raoultella terrigena]|nr:YhhN-like protein [Raoultella terrigena]
MYAVGAFFLSHLLYTIWFASQMTLSFFWPLPLVLLVVGALLLAVIWTRLEEMRLPVFTFIGMTLVMVWLAGELWFVRPTDTALSGFIGAAFLLLGNIVWLVSHYRRRFRADNAIAAAFYFAGHFLIVRALYL